LARRPRKYEAFISYSHEADSAFAAELQRTLNRIARPSYKWWQWWPPRVFRDQTNLAAAPDLAAEIKEALLASDSLVLLASPQAAGSRWVDREAATWCEQRPRDRLLIALTDGALVWDGERRDFDGTRTNALPPALAGVFQVEPLWVDFTAVRAQDGHRSNPTFLDGAATLAAAIRGTDKDRIIGEDARQQRRTKQLVAGAVALLSLLAVAATAAAIYALVQRNRADERARLATSRQLAAEALVALDTNPEQSLVLAARAATTAPTDEAADALRQALRTSRLRATVDAGAPVADTAVDPTGRLVAAALENGSIHIWTLRTGKPVAKLQLAGAPAERVQFSHDGRRLLGAGKAGVVVWSTGNGRRRPIAVFDKAGQPFAATFSPNGKLVATGDVDGVVRLWRSETGAPSDELRVPGMQPVTAVSFGGDGSTVAAAEGRQAVVWRLRTKPLLRTRPLRVLHASKDVWAVAVSPDGRHVATGDTSGHVRIWNLRSGAAVVLNGHTGTIQSLDFSPNGKSLVTASDDETVRIWDASTGRSLGELRGHGNIVESATFAPNGKTVVTGGEDGTIRVWAAASDPIDAELAARDNQALRDIDFDASGDRIVAASEDLTAPLWNVESERLLRALSHAHGGEEWVESAEFSHDGRLVVTAGDDGTAKVWESSSGALLATLGQPGGPSLLDAALSSDGRLLATAGEASAPDKAVIRLWRWRHRKQLMSFRDFGGRADGVAFSPSGDLLAGVGQHQVRVWRVTDGAPVAVLLGRGELTSVAFDPSDAVIAAGSSRGFALLWDLRSKNRIALLAGHSDTVAAVAFSADGGFLATAGNDGIAKVWTVPGGDLVTTLRSRAPRLEGAAFAPHGRRVAVAGDGGRVTIFDCAECRPLRSLVCLAATRVTPRVRAPREDPFRRCD
jgi:WD40 repeat protein